MFRAKTRRLVVTGSVAMVTVILVCSHAAQADLVSNGSFESPELTQAPWWGYTDDIDDWGPVSWQTSAGFANVNLGKMAPVPDGDQWAWIIGTWCNASPGFVSTTVDTSGFSPTDYPEMVVDFYIGAGNDDGADRSLRVQLIGYDPGAPQPYPELDHEIVSGPTAAGTWVHEVVRLDTQANGTYTGEDVYLAFRWESGDNETTEITIDNVVVTPEPGTLVLLGVSGVALLRRQRRGR